MDNFGLMFWFQPTELHGIHACVLVSTCSGKLLVARTLPIGTEFWESSHTSCLFL